MHEKQFNTVLKKIKVKNLGLKIAALTLPPGLIISFFFFFFFLFPFGGEVFEGIFQTFQFSNVLAQIEKRTRHWVTGRIRFVLVVGGRLLTQLQSDKTFKTSGFVLLKCLF